MIQEEQTIIGQDWYPYGIEPNRPTIEALLQYTHEQGSPTAGSNGGAVRAEHDARHSLERRAAGLGALRQSGARRRREHGMTHAGALPSKAAGAVQKSANFPGSIHGAATSRHHHERRHRTHGHEPAPDPLDLAIRDQGGVG